MFRCSVPSIRLDQSVVGRLLVLDVCDDPLLLVLLLGGSGTSLTLAFSCLFSSFDLGKSLVVLKHLLRMDFLLDLLGICLLLNGTVLRNLLNVELMLSLELVSFATNTEQNAKEDDGEEKASDGVIG